MMELKINHKALYEAAREQRVKLADSEAMLLAAVAVLQAELEAAKAELAKLRKRKGSPDPEPPA